MSKSLEFCKQRASDKSVSSYADSDWSKAYELKYTPGVFEFIVKGYHKYRVQSKSEDGAPLSFGVTLEFNPDADFDYFTSERFLSDGTLLFLDETMRSVAGRVCMGASFPIGKTSPVLAKEIKYTIGNFVVLNELNGDWIPEEKPWMSERTTVLLPLKYDVLK